MASIICLIETVLRNQFRCNYNKNKNFLRIFFSILKIYLKFEMFFQKKVTFIADLFPKFRAPKNVVR